MTDQSSDYARVGPHKPRARRLQADARASQFAEKYAVGERRRIHRSGVRGGKTPRPELTVWWPMHTKRRFDVVCVCASTGSPFGLALLRRLETSGTWNRTSFLLGTMDTSTPAGGKDGFSLSSAQSRERKRS